MVRSAEYNINKFRRATMSRIGKVSRGGVLSFRWRIPDFATHCKSPGQFIDSPTFAKRWSLRMYPKGYKKSVDTHDVYVYLYNESREDVTARTVFYFIDDKGDRIDKVHQVPKKLYKPGDGVRKYLGKRSMLWSLLGSATTLGIQCEIFYYGESDDLPGEVAVKTEAAALETDSDAPTIKEEEEEEQEEEIDPYEQLMESKKFSDVTLVLGDKIIRAHKSILAFGSTVFDAMFSTVKEEGDQQPISVVSIGKVGYAVFKEMVRFIYARKVKGVDAIARDLLLAAQLYGVEELKVKCADAIVAKLSVAGVFECLEFAQSHGLTDLKARLMLFIRCNADQVMDDAALEAFAERSPALMCDVTRAIVKRPKLG